MCSARLTPAPSSAACRSAASRVFPADTVYGLACEPDSREAVDRLYTLKRRRPDKPAAVMFFDARARARRAAGAGAAHARGARGAAARRPDAAAAQPGRPLPARRRRSDARPARARRSTARSRALAGVRWPVLQSSANLAGGPDARRARRGARARSATPPTSCSTRGELPGTPSTVVDLRAFERDGTFAVVREGAVPADEIARRLAP